ncbi:MAG: excinuclease ABC subunit UvrC [Bacillota bacterium]
MPDDGRPAPGEAIEAKLARLPAKPGVYLFKDQEGRIIYIGKARSLRNRVRQYFQSSRNLNPRTLTMVAQVRDFEFVRTDSEVEALILESNLVKEHHPYYNVRLKDDKHFPYLRVDPNEAFPRVTIARSMRRDGALYFGPYTHPDAVRDTLRTIRRVFPFRICSDHKFHSVTRPCLDHHVHRCLGPCRGMVSAADYKAMVKELCLFLEGRTQDITDRLRRRMDEAAEALDFEGAAGFRDQLKAIEQVSERQKIISTGMEDQDVVALARHGDEASVQVFQIRGGRLVGREGFILSGAEDQAGSDVITAFLKQFYAQASFIPKEVLVPEPVPDAELIEQWLSSRRGEKVRLSQPKRGEKRGLVELATENARVSMQERVAERAREQEQTGDALRDLARELGLGEVPRRIECFDISNIQGAEAVGSMVVFEDGRPKKEDYRRFKIKTVEGPNDFAMMAEVVGRRYRRGLHEREETAIGAPKFAVLPDLIIVDGGKGQLSAAREVLEGLGLGGIATFGLAKENEWLFGVGRSAPVILARGSEALFLVQRIRDEAHRFAIGYHRLVRKKRTLKSALDEIPGIGPRRRTMLLRRFGSVAGLRRATLDEIKAVEGLPVPLAETIYARLHATTEGGVPDAHQ